MSNGNKESSRQNLPGNREGDKPKKPDKQKKANNKPRAERSRQEPGSQGQKAGADNDPITRGLEAIRQSQERQTRILEQVGQGILNLPEALKQMGQVEREAMAAARREMARQYNVEPLPDDPNQWTLWVLEKIANIENSTSTPEMLLNPNTRNPDFNALMANSHQLGPVLSRQISAWFNSFRAKAMLGGGTGPEDYFKIAPLLDVQDTLSVFFGQKENNQKTVFAEVVAAGWDALEDRGLAYMAPDGRMLDPAGKEYFGLAPNDQSTTVARRARLEREITDAIKDRLIALVPQRPDLTGLTPDLAEKIALAAKAMALGLWKTTLRSVQFETVGCETDIIATDEHNNPIFQPAAGNNEPQPFKIWRPGVSQKADQKQKSGWKYGFPGPLVSPIPIRRLLIPYAARTEVGIQYVPSILNRLDYGWQNGIIEAITGKQHLRDENNRPSLIKTDRIAGDNTPVNPGVDWAHKAGTNDLVAVRLSQIDNTRKLAMPFLNQPYNQEHLEKLCLEGFGNIDKVRNNYQIRALVTGYIEALKQRGFAARHLNALGRVVDTFKSRPARRGDSEMEEATGRLIGSLNRVGVENLLRHLEDREILQAQDRVQIEQLVFGFGVKECKRVGDYKVKEQARIPSTWPVKWLRILTAEAPGATAKISLGALFAGFWAGLKDFKDRLFKQ